MRSGAEVCPEDACPKRFSWFFYWIPKVQKCANLVELEKCCQTHIFLQNLASIQPNTSPFKLAPLESNRKPWKALRASVLRTRHTVPRKRSYPAASAVPEGAAKRECTLARCSTGGRRNRSKVKLLATDRLKTSAMLVKFQQKHNFAKLWQIFQTCKNSVR